MKGFGIILGITSLLLLLSRGGKLVSPVAFKIRNDSWGLGYFGAPRRGASGPRLHNGIDLVVVPSQGVVSPINGVVLRRAYPYQGDQAYEGIYIQGIDSHKDYMVKIFYMSPFSRLIGESVSAGQRIGRAQDISQRYTGMIPHIHFELYYKNGRVDPAKFV